MKLNVIKLTDSSINEIEMVAMWFNNWYEWPKPYWTYNRIKRCLITMVNNKRFSSIFVAKNGDKVVGTVGVAKYDDTKNCLPKYFPWIVNGFVLEKYRRKGVYKTLLKEAEQHLINNGFDKVYIRTDWQGLYENMGWQYLQDIVLDNGNKEKLYVKNLK